MEYRKHAGVKVSALGFGCMRFPTREDGRIDEAEAFRMLDRAWARGVTYYDTAYPYHDGESELVVGRWLATKPREEVVLATKLPVHLVKQPSDVERIFNEQLEKLGTDYVDFYLLHAMGAERWEIAKQNDILATVSRLKAEGKIRKLGFSFHDEYPVFEEMVNAFDWDFCQLQLNYMDVDEQAGLRGCRLAVAHGMTVSVMEPVKGGSLASPPAEIMDRYRALQPGWSAASWALRWVSELPGVAVVLSGMTTMAQVEDNLDTFDTLRPLTDSERAAVAQAAELYRARTVVPCTGCRYCMPCPVGVDIPGIFKIRNEGAVFDAPASAKAAYGRMQPENRQTACVRCGRCATLCPQHISIPEKLAEAHAYLTAE